MYVTRIEATGFGGLPTVDLALDRVTTVDGPPRATTALADALTLGFAAFDRALLLRLLTRWGCRGTEVTGDALAEAAHWESAPGLAGVLDPGGDGLLSVALTFQLDPPQYGRLRKEAARDPRLVDALADGASVTLKVGARFSPALDAMALDPLGFSVGGESFPIAGADRPPWLSPFLHGLGGRLWRGPVADGAWATASGSYRVADHRSLKRALTALRGPPLSLGEVVVMPDGPARVEAEAVVPIRLHGERLAREVGLVGAVYLSGAELLLVEDPPRGWGRWFATQALADGSPLEQVILVGAPGGQRVG